MWRKDRRKHGEGSQLAHLHCRGVQDGRWKGGEEGACSSRATTSPPPGRGDSRPTQGSPIQSNRAHVALGAVGISGDSVRSNWKSQTACTIPSKEGFLSYNIDLGCSLQFMSEEEPRGKDWAWRRNLIGTPKSNLSSPLLSERTLG